jgi:hypothetical protein
LETLKPFVNWTTFLSVSSSVTVSLVPRAVHELLALAETPLTEGGNRAAVANEMRARLGAELRRIFRDVVLPSTIGNLPVAHMARFLDPRTVREVIFPSENVDNDSDGEEEYTHCSIAMIKRVIDDLKAQLPSDEQDEALPTWASEVSDFGNADGGGRYAVRDLTIDISYCPPQIRGKGGQPLNVDPLGWWKNAAPDLPYLAEFARRYLAVPATTTESERMFSLAGAVASPVRSRLSPARVNELVVVRAHHLHAVRRRNSPTAAVADIGELQEELMEDGELSIDFNGYIEDSDAAP